MLSDDNCFPGHSTTSDGTPGIGNLEAIRVTKVTKDGLIISPLVCFELYDKSPKGEEHGHHLVSGQMNVAAITSTVRWHIVQTRTAALLIPYALVERHS